MSAVIDGSHQMSVHEFLSWHPADGRAWQLVDGVPQAMAPASLTHGILQGELSRLIGNHLTDRDSHCRLVVAPGVVPHIQASYNVRIPDLAVTCADPDTQEAVLTDPALIVEILSPSNEAETWANVWAYTTIPSVREILVLRTATIGADVLRRGADGGWPPEPLHVTSGDLDLVSIGLRVDLAGLYRLTPPAPPPRNRPAVAAA